MRAAFRAVFHELLTLVRLLSTLIFLIADFRFATWQILPKSRIFSKCYYREVNGITGPKAMVIKNLFLQRQESIISAASFIGLTFLGSAVLGLARDWLLARFYGASNLLGIFYLADRLPSFIFNIFVVGSFSAAFIPIFTKYRYQNEETGWKLASQTLLVTLASFFVLAGLMFILAPQVAMGLVDSKLSVEEFSLLVSLLRVMLFAQLILIISNFFTALLQSFRHFIMPALAPILYNVGLIIGILFSTHFGLIAAAWGMVLGATLHLLIQLQQVIAVGFTLKRFVGFRWPPFLEMVTLLIPRTLSVVLDQLSLLVNSYLAALVSLAAVGPYTFAAHLQNLPLAVFGVSISQALFPTLSQKALGEDLTAFRKTFFTSFMQLAFLTLPVAAVFLILRVPVVRLAFGTANISWSATLTTSYVLAFLALALFPQAASLSLIKGFYALHDTRTPLKISGLTTILNIILVVVAIRGFGFGVWGISLAYFVAAVIEFMGLLFLLGRKIGGLSFEQLGRPFFKILLATIVMAGFLYWPLKQLDLYVLDTSRTINLLILTTIAGFSGLTIYATLTYFLKVTEIELLWQLLRRVRQLLTFTPPTAYGSEANS